VNVVRLVTVSCPDTAAITYDLRLQADVPAWHGSTIGLYAIPVIYRSDLPQSGYFDLLLVVKFASTADLAPNN
jgi:hypothetical protein